MKKLYGQITGWGSYVPEKIITNADLEKLVDTSDEWIVRRTGIRERRMVAPHETTATISVEASKLALNRANLKPTDLDLIVLAATFQDHICPSTSSLVQHMLGATNVPAFTLTSGCTGFVYALSVANQFIETGAYRRILVIGSEIITRALDWTDRSTCVLFGDGSAAMVMEATTEPCGISGFDLGSDGSGYENIIIPAGGSAEPFGADTFAEGRHHLQMNGREVFKFASRVLGKSTNRTLEQSGLTMDDIAWIVPHQANLRIIQAASRNMNVPLEKFIIAVHKYGNTSAASIPIAICDALDEGKIALDNKLLLVSFGAGLTWASCVLQMAPTRVRKEPVVEIEMDLETAVPA
ncbi:MAG: beta-ketoacyl-ACP synthase III [Chloroflexota bacterium]